MIHVVIIRHLHKVLQYCYCIISYRITCVFHIKVHYLGSIGGKDVNETTRRILRTLFENSVASRMNFVGCNGKTPLQHTKLLRCIIGWFSWTYYYPSRNHNIHGVLSNLCHTRAYWHTNFLLNITCFAFISYGWDAANRFIKRYLLMRKKNIPFKPDNFSVTGAVHSCLI